MSLQFQELSLTVVIMLYNIFFKFIPLTEILFLLTSISLTCPKSIVLASHLSTRSPLTLTSWESWPLIHAAKTSFELLVLRPPLFKSWELWPNLYFSNHTMIWTFFIHFLTIYVATFEEYQFMSFAHLKTVICSIIAMFDNLCILEINLLSDV